MLEERRDEAMENEAFNLYLKAARYYDCDNRDIVTADIPFYLEYAQKIGGEILELGCGTGRIAIPLAEAGYTVTGLDLSDSMLDVFKAKMENLSEKVKNRIKCIKGDMSNFSLNVKYGLIIAPFRAFQSLTEESDINKCLTYVREHLSEEGIFIVNVFRPYKILDESWCYPETVSWETLDKDTGLMVTKKHWGSKIDVERQVIYVNYAYEILGKAGCFERIEEKLSLKYYYYQQLKDYLKACGFEVSEEYGWYDKSDVENGRELIFVCRKAG
jgi:ubiquinone/menaquinone biosynthesis C-methylase UbiE